jgi:hypothetical protein
MKKEERERKKSKFNHQKWIGPMTIRVGLKKKEIESVCVCVSP